MESGRYVGSGRIAGSQLGRARRRPGRRPVCGGCSNGSQAGTATQATGGWRGDTAAGRGSLALVGDARRRDAHRARPAGARRQPRPQGGAVEAAAGARAARPRPDRLVPERRRHSHGRHKPDDGDARRRGRARKDRTRPASTRAGRWSSPQRAATKRRPDGPARQATLRRATCRCRPRPRVASSSSASRLLRLRRAAARSGLNTRLIMRHHVGSLSVLREGRGDD